MTREIDEWRPSDLYSSSSLSRRSTYSVVSSGAHASYLGALPTVSSGSSSMFRHGVVSSYAPAVSVSNSQLPIAGTASYSQSPIAYSQRLHTTSSAEFRSFGGGGNVGGVSMSGGQVKSSNSSVVTASGLNVSMPSTSMYAYNTNRNGSSASDMVASISGDIAMASSYQGIGNTTGPRGMNGRKNVPGIGGVWTGWLGNGDFWGEGYEDWAGGSNQVTWERLRALYVAATGDTDFSNEEEWEAFLAWFNSKQSDDTFGWYWVPISDAIPFVLLLCMIYAVLVYRKTRITKKMPRLKNNMKIQNNRYL